MTKPHAYYVAIDQKEDVYIVKYLSKVESLTKIDARTLSKHFTRYKSKYISKHWEVYKTYNFDGKSFNRGALANLS